MGLKDSDANLCMSINRRRPLSLSHPNLFRRFKHQDGASCCWMCHGILPKEHSGTFYEVPWGLFKEMSTNTQVQSDIVTHTTNI
jgi:hypothetical protein